MPAVQLAVCVGMWNVGVWPPHGAHMHRAGRYYRWHQCSLGVSLHGKPVGTLPLTVWRLYKTTCTALPGSCAHQAHKHTAVCR